MSGYHQILTIKRQLCQNMMGCIRIRPLKNTIIIVKLEAIFKKHFFLNIARMLEKKIRIGVVTHEHRKLVHILTRTPILPDHNYNTGARS